MKKNEAKAAKKVFLPALGSLRTQKLVRKIQTCDGLACRGGGGGTLVVLTIVSVVLFARFFTVEHNPTL